MKSLAEKVDPKKAALLVIDMQNDFCHADGASSKNGGDVTAQQAIVPALNKLIESSRRVGMPVIFLQITNSPETESEVWLERRADRKYYSCAKGSWGADFYGVSPLSDELVIEKHRFSGFVRTNLDQELQARQIESVILTGVITNACVESTARDAFMHDYFAVVVDDCTATSDPERHKEALERISKTFGVVAKAEGIVALWSGVPLEAVAPSNP